MAAHAGGVALGGSPDRTDRLARGGDPEPIHIEETETAFAIGWKGHDRVEGSIFVYADRHTGRITSIHGYPTDRLTQIG